MRRMLVTTLYTQPTSLAIGAFNGIACTAIAAWVSGLQILYATCILLTVIAMSRILAAMGLSPSQANTSTRKLELVYEVGAFSYAFLLGSIAAITIALEAGTEVEVLMIANATCYGVGICAR
ncbi:MAG: GGDEF-domain containing protein, partial [Sphingomonadales bacterium]